MSYSTTSPLTKANMFFFGREKIKHWRADECMTAFFHFSFPYVNIVVLEEYHFSWMLEYIFLSCQDFLKLIPRVTHSRRTRRQWEPSNEDTFDEARLKSLWCCTSLWGWFQLLCALQGCSSYGLSHQIRNGTYTPPLFLNNQHIVFSSCLSTTQHICFIMYGLLRGIGEEGWRIQGGK